MTAARIVFAAAVFVVSVTSPISVAAANPDHEHHEECRPSDSEVRSASEFAETTAEHTQRYTDVRAALADGYRPFLVVTIVLPVVHYTKQEYHQDGHVANPDRPETLVYANTYAGPKLLGVMYLMEPEDAEPPDLGGCIVQWHRHVICEHPNGRKTPSPNESWCPPGTARGETASMLHVWTQPMENGPYQRHPDPRWQCWPRPALVCGG